MKHGMEPIVGPLPSSEEWHAWRMNGIFASEAGAACGVSEYGQPLDVFLLKCGLVEPKETTDAMARGKRFEPFILQEYTERTGGEIATGLPLYLHPEYRHIGATPDAVRTDKPKHGVEAKLCNWRRAAALGEEFTDEVFPDWVMQCQQQMAVLDWDVCDLIVLQDVHSYRLFSVERNEQLIESLIETETKLWQRILERDPPAPIYDKPGALNSVRKLFGLGSGCVQLGEYEAALAREFSDVKEQIRELEERKDELHARLLHALGEHESGLLPLGKRELKKVVVRDTLWTTTDVDVAIKSLGKVKRKGHVRLMETNVKKG